MFRFTIRDVLWLTVVVAALSAWHQEYRTANKRQAEHTAREEELKKRLADAEDPTKIVQKLLEARNTMRPTQWHFPLHYPSDPPDPDLY